MLVALAGGAFELWRFGASAAGASARLERQVRGDFDRMTGVLSRAAAGVATDPVAARALGAGPDAARDLFDLVDRRVSEAGGEVDDVAATIYDMHGVARAWGGRPSDIRAPDRLAGPSAFFVTPSPLGLRLVHLLPIIDSQQHRVGSVAVEHVLSPASAAATITASDFLLPTPLGPASLRMRWEGAGGEVRENAFVLRAPEGDPLVEVSMAPGDIDRARTRLRRSVGAAVLVTLSITLLLLMGPVLDRRADAKVPSMFMAATGVVVALLAGAGSLVWIALSLGRDEAPGTPALLLLGGVTGAGIVALLAGPAARLRVAQRARRTSTIDAPWAFVLLQLCAGAAVAAVLVAFDRLLLRAVDPAAVDLRHFSLHPWVAARLALLTGILASHLAALWAGTLMLNASLARWRFGTPISTLLRARLALVWVAPTAAVAALAYARGWPLPAFAIIASAAVCALAALAAPRVVVWFRHTTVAARIVGFFIAFLVPALLLYPSVDFHAERAMQALIATRFAVQAQRQQQTLQDHLSEALREIDALEVLPVLVASDGAEPAAEPRPDNAILVWKQTALARARLTSAIELYDRSGGLVSRFALNYPEYSVAKQAPQAASGCEWDVFGEATPFGSEERTRPARRPPDLRRHAGRGPRTRRHDRRARPPLRLPVAAVHHVAEPVFRGFPPCRGGRTAGRDDGQRRGRRDLRLEPQPHLHVRPRGVADH